jgi:hypothetical protein
VTADPGQAEKITHAILGQFYTCLIGYLSNIRTSGTWKDQNFTWLT